MPPGDYRYCACSRLHSLTHASLVQKPVLGVENTSADPNPLRVGKSLLNRLLMGRKPTPAWAGSESLFVLTYLIDTTLA
jgi:hypothetical protein